MLMKIESDADVIGRLFHVMVCTIGASFDGLMPFWMPDSLCE